MLCYETCETCEIKEDNINHNCLKCNSNYPFAFNISNNYFNCIPTKNSEIKKEIENLLKYEKNETKANEDIMQYYQIIFEIIEQGFIPPYYEASNIDKGIDEIFETEKMKITFTSSENQKN